MQFTRNNYSADRRNGATATRVIAHLESFRVNTVDIRAAYVAISRAREGATIYTDSRPKLTEALGIRDGSQVGAIDETLLRDDRAKIGIKTRNFGSAIAL